MPAPTAATTPKAATKTCLGHTRAGKRCRRAARPGSPYCAQHAEQATADEELPVDIDREALDDAIADLAGARPGRNGADSGARGAYGETDADESSGPLDELRMLADYVGDNIGQIRDVAVGSGLVAEGVVERFASDLLHAITSLTQGVAERFAGDYEEDDFGFDPRFTERLLPMFALLYRYWFRVDVEGIENVPAEGRALLVANHAGSGIPLDGVMMKIAMLLEHRQPRHIRPMALDWLMGIPWLADLAKQTGQALACTPNAMELLRRDEAIAVFPEGVKGMAKPFSSRYQLQRFGRGGFVRVALRTGSPIIPVAVVGSEETYPKIANMPILPRLIGAPFVPITPLFPLFGILGLVPLPSKWHIEFCEPIDVSGYTSASADDRALVLELSERVRQTIQERVHANLLKRRTPFW